MRGRGSRAEDRVRLVINCVLSGRAKFTARALTQGWASQYPSAHKYLPAWQGGRSTVPA